MTPDIPNDNGNEEGLFDENGQLRFKQLTKGMFVLRFTESDNKLLFTWIPDDFPQQAIEQTSVEVPKPPSGENLGGVPEYLACLTQNAPAGGNREDQIAESLLAILKCSKHL